MSGLVIVFTGQPRSGFDFEKAKAAFCRSFSVSSAQLDAMFKRVPIPVKKGLDKHKAHSLVKKLWVLGWHSEIHRAGKSIYATDSISRRNNNTKAASSQHSVEVVIESVLKEASSSGRSLSLDEPVTETKPSLTRKMVSIDQDVELYVPGSWHEATQLNPVACIQAECVESDAYLVVVPQRKDEVVHIDSIEQYANEIIQHSSGLVDLANIDTGLTQLDHAKQRCFYGELTATHEDRNIRYILAVFESASCYYTMYIWTVQENAENLKDLMLRIIRNTQIHSV